MILDQIDGEHWRSMLTRVLETFGLKLEDLIIYEPMEGAIDSDYGSDEYDAGFVAWSDSLVFTGIASNYNSHSMDVIQVTPRNPVRFIEERVLANRATLQTKSVTFYSPDAFFNSPELSVNDNVMIEVDTGFVVVFVPAFQEEPPAADLD